MTKIRFDTPVGLYEKALPVDWFWMFLTVPIGLWAAWALTKRFAPEAAGDAETTRPAEMSSRCRGAA